MPTGEEGVASDKLVFSFKCLDLDHRRFSPSNCNVEFFRELLSKIAEISRLTRNDFIGSQQDGNRLWIHRIDWSDERSPLSENSFGLSDELTADENAWQFDTSRSGRVYGYLLGGTFFVRWFDQDHRLYATKRSREKK
jgi:hypothetical protein